jgi:hypothetical protein
MPRKKATTAQKKKVTPAKAASSKATAALDKRAATRWLRETYEQHGYIRVKTDSRRRTSRSWEIRLWADDAKQSRRLSIALATLDLTSGKPFAKRNGFIVPLYGKQQVEQFLKRVKPKVKSEIPDGS